MSSRKSGKVPPNNQQPSQAVPTGAVGSGPGQQPPSPSAAASGTKPKTGQQNTTQNSLLISEIRDGMVIMSDGSFRAVIACKSINFDLMSSREREGVEFSYQNFLNALYFPIQIFVRSQRVDIGPYIDRLSTIRRAQDNMLLNVLMDDYINFIDVLSQEANIMDKSFFVIIPYFPAGDLSNVLVQSKGIFGKIFSKPQTTATKIDKVSYEKAKDEIKNRVDSVTSGLFQIGVNSVQLNTKELGELYYNMYNPDTAVREPLGDFEDVTSTFVQKGTGEAPRPHLQEGDM
jgi:type IV secretory pathway VirB4 component